MKKIFLGLIILGIGATAFFVVSRSSGAQEPPAAESRIKQEGLRQMNTLLREKKSRTTAQKKIDSNLLYAVKMKRGQKIADGVESLQTDVTVDEAGFTEVDIVAAVTPNLLGELKRINAKIIVSLPAYRSITASVPIESVEALAAMPEVVFIMPRQKAQSSGAYQKSAEDKLSNGFGSVLAINEQSNFNNRAINVRDFLSTRLGEAENQNFAIETGSVTWQGDITHQANIFRSTTGFNGAGVKIGVISNGVDSLAGRQATGDLPSNVTILSGQAGSGDEGTAMLEIVYDVAPGAQLYYATGFTSPASFAQNIRALRSAGCSIIIDDVSYFNESAFQNGQAANVISNTQGGVVIQAVNDVTVGNQAGALYFSSAANSGNKNDGTAGAWEGDFVDAGPAPAPLQGQGNLHNFGGQVYDVITMQGSSTTSLKWSDPLGGSANDYDLFILDSSGSFVVGAGTNEQSGTQDPYESVSNANAVGNVVVIIKYSGVGRFLHLNTNRSTLSVSTSGTVYGHNAGMNTISIAATPAGPATNGTTGTVGPYPNAHSSANQVEKFSSDGPRRIFYNADGTLITPGNVSSTGGQLLAKPDLTAADGGSTTTPTFSPFFGTSAAAPTAGALAGLVKSGCPSSTNAQIINRFKATAIDIEAPGIDRDSGSGIMMPIPAFSGLCSVAPTGRKSFDYDGDGKSDLSVFRPSNGYWYLQNSTTGFTYSGFGINGDQIAPADYDGDGKTDLAVFRPSNGSWYLLRSTAGFTQIQFGASGDLPMPADFDGDGKAEIAIFRPSTGVWYTFNVTNNQSTSIAFGISGDTPTAGDYDGDGKADIAVFRQSNGTWYLNRSQLGFTAIQFGANGDKAVPADYDGDGKTDLAVWRPSNGVWYLQRSTAGFTNSAFGITNDLPAPADFDGDGKTDLGIFRPSSGVWYLQRTTQGFTQIQFGANGDKPTPNAFVP